MNFLIICKNLLGKFCYIYAGVILEIEGSIEQSSNVNNCSMLLITNPMLISLNEVPKGVLTDNAPSLI